MRICTHSLTRSPAACVAVAGSLLAGGALTTAGAAPLPAQEASTRVMVRAVAHDAKIIGSGVGGARITIRDAASGEVLARGVQEGGTGDTQRIVVAPRARDERVYDTEGAAGFLAELDLDRPTRVEITAEGPLGIPHATQRASRTLLLVPGEHVLGDGVVLELYGFTVELLEPGPHDELRPGDEVTVRARVTMLCGCPTEPGGLWDADDIRVVARIVGDGRVLEEAPISFLEGVESTWEGTLPVPEGDAVRIQVLAMEPEEGNFGIVERPLPVGGAADRSRSASRPGGEG